MPNDVMIYGQPLVQITEEKQNLNLDTVVDGGQPEQFLTCTDAALI